MAALIHMRNNVAGIKVPLLGEIYRLGRGDDNDVVIEEDLISREHAVIERVAGGALQTVRYLIRDAGSTNGTFVNNKQITELALNDGDMIRLGQTFFRFSLHERGTPSDTRVLRKTIIPGVFYTTEKKT